MRSPKQLLNIIGRDTMLRETMARLRPLFPPRKLWIVTNDEQAVAVRRELPRVSSSHVLAEPSGRNTAAAIGLAAIHLAHRYGDALMAVLPSDHYIADAARYRRLVGAALKLAENNGFLIVMGIPPTRPETGFGYIERGKLAGRPGGFPAYEVRRFTEKPSLPLARRYVASRHYLWNAGMFFWRVSTFLEKLKKYLPATHAALFELSRAIGTPGYARAIRRIYPHLENISVDYAIMEPSTRRAGTGTAPRVFVLPAQVGWSDIGSWTAVYELLAHRPGENISAGPRLALDSSGNFFWSPEKFIAAIGVHDLVLVETPDALLVCQRDRAQDVGQIVKWLEARKNWNLL